MSTPRCSTTGCDKPPTVKLGFHGFDGSGSRFICTGWACDDHRPKFAIEYT